MFKKSWGIVISLVLMLLLASACGNSNGGTQGSDTGGGTTPPPQNTETPPTNEPPAPPKPADPVKLVMLQDGATISDEEFANLIAAPVKAKYPHITVEMHRNSGGNAGLQNLIAGGEFPDFMFTTYPQIKAHRELNTPLDLTALVKKHNLDLNKFDPAAMETSRVYGGSNDQIYAIPFSLNFLALFYNVDLFDRFGVDYPTAGMTWDEFIILGRSLARTVDGIEYKGIAALPGVGDLSTQLSLPRVDGSTMKANITTDEWKRVVEVIKTINDLPGNKNANLNMFLKDKIAAMAPSYDARIAALELLHGTPEDFNWDITQFPSFPERPDTSLASSGHFLMISSLSKHQEEAFQVIDLLTTTENQKLITEHGRFTSLSDQTIKDMYGVNMKSLEGKNIKAVFQSAFAPPYPPTEYDKFVTPHLNAAVKSVIEGEMDINSALRQAEEAANRDIEAEKLK